MNVVLSIAGSDSGGGAGIQADLKTFEAHGVFGVTVITAVTAQNTVGVRAIHEVPLEIIAAQLDAVFDDFNVAAVKVGMLASSRIIELVARRLERIRGVPVVVDPVMVATSGDPLLKSDAVDTLRGSLLPIARLVTPNLDEARVLSGMSVDSIKSGIDAAIAIRGSGIRGVLVKGGHLAARSADAWGTDSVPRATDVLVDGEKAWLLHAPWIERRSPHGTGCTLSAAITANLAIGHDMLGAVRRAKDYLHAAIKTAPLVGSGAMPLRHSHGRS